ncbi:hypothetical protein GO755_03345 [Spirosoma sp. HMF4905]|uniref:Uncharacterized protein n=1 Tax=Spirosoma arboris TaxID=2682092 RepID=A0A7K1S5E8_9BACT|nr:hypothetical protein [Spirosoma arboris]MVM29053.1 hypothetical protein [Spirosoma arboris]
MQDFAQLRNRIADFVANQDHINGFYIQAWTVDEVETDEYIFRVELRFSGFRLLFTQPKSIYRTLADFPYYITTVLTGIEGMYLGKVAFLANETAYAIKEVYLDGLVDKVYIYPPVQDWK